jgi:hypothetical protein
MVSSFGDHSLVPDMLTQLTHKQKKHFAQFAKILGPSHKTTIIMDLWHGVFKKDIGQQQVKTAAKTPRLACQVDATRHAVNRSTVSSNEKFVCFYK